MDFQKTILELLKKYVEENRKEDEKTDKNTENADFEQKTTEKVVENEQKEEDKTEKLNFVEEEKEEKISEDDEIQAEPKDEPKDITAEKTEVNLGEPEMAKEESDDEQKPTPQTFEELTKYLDEIEEEYKPVSADDELPEYMNLERKEEITTTPEEIAQKVEEDLAMQKDQEQAAIDKKYDDKEAALEEQKKTINEHTNSQEQTINSVYDAERTKTENDTLKRGLARSSIVCELLSGIEKERAQKLTELGKELALSLEKIESDLASLESNRVAALDDLNVAYAVKMQEQIDKKLAELKKQQDAVIEYNNKITEIEKKYNLSLDEKRSKLQAEAQKKADAKNAEQKTKKQKDQIALLTNYFSRYDKQRAIYELQKHSEIASRYGVEVYYGVYKNLISTNK